MSSIDELSQLPAPEAPPLAQVLEAELAHLTPVATRRPIHQLVLLVAVSLVYSAGLILMLALRKDIHELPMGWLVSAGLAWLLGFIVPVYLATVPRAGSVMPRWRLAGAAAVAAAIALIGLGLMLHPDGAQALGWDGVIGGYGCLANGLETAIVPVFVGTILLRRTVPIGSRWVAAALGASGGSLGGLVLHLHCPVTDSLHVGLVHGGVIVIAALLAAALASRVTEVR